MAKDLAEKIYDLCSYKSLGVGTAYAADVHQYLSGASFNKARLSDIEEKISGTGLREIIKNRQSHRKFSSARVKLKHMHYLCLNGYSLKSETGSFTVPLAGGLNTMHLSVLVKKRKAWALYHWEETKYELNTLKHQIASLEDLFFSRSTDFSSASAAVIISANLNVLSMRYATRAYKFACIQAGHIAQNLLLSAAEQSLSSLVLGALKEENIVPSCKLDNLQPLYAVILG